MAGMAVGQAHMLEDVINWVSRRIARSVGRFRRLVGFGTATCGTHVLLWGVGKCLCGFLMVSQFQRYRTPHQHALHTARLCFYTCMSEASRGRGCRVVYVPCDLPTVRLAYRAKPPQTSRRNCISAAIAVDTDKALLITNVPKITVGR